VEGRHGRHPAGPRGFTVALAAATFAACTGDSPGSDANAAFARYVAFGNSITAGIQSGGKSLFSSIDWTGRSP